jgi:hypothetical protein
MAWKLTFAIIATIVLGGGVVFAADGAVPGEPLYGLDRATEAIQTRLTGDPEALLSLHLRLAEERLLEAQELAGTQGDAHVQKALRDYAASMASVGEIMASADALSQAAFLETIEETLSDYSSLLVSLPSLDADEEQDDENEGEDDVDDPEDGEAEDNSFCVSEEENHPAAERLAAALPEDSDITIEDIMAWFCGDDEGEGDLPHFGFGEIKQVLELSGGSVISATELLETKADGMGWGLIKQAVQLTGGNVFSATELLEAKANGQGWGQIKKDYNSNGESAEPDSVDGLSEGTGPGNSGAKGRPDHAGPPELRGQSAQSGRPDHAGPPQNQGQSGNQGKGKGRGRP